MHVRTFNDFAEFMERERQARDVMAEHIQGWQQSLGPGDHFIRFYEGLTIFGEIISSKYPEDQEMMRDNPHLVMANCYSVACIEGEVGMVHRATIAQKITPAQFRTARKHDWAL